MSSKENTSSKTLGFFDRVRLFWKPLTLLVACFVAGIWFQAKLDSSLIELQKAEIDYLRDRSAESLEIEDFFAKFDIAQMSPTGEYALLFGDGSIGGRPSSITHAIDSAINAIENGKHVQAIVKLNEASKMLPTFPFTYYYLGIAELSNVSSRAMPHFDRAHELFTSLLRIRPNNSQMRFCDAMALTYLGHGDSATMQLYRAHMYDPKWRQLGCTKMLLRYDSTALSKEELQTWSQFVSALGDIRCESTKLSRGSEVIDVLPPLPKIQWPTGYTQPEK